MTLMLCGRAGESRELGLVLFCRARGKGVSDSHALLSSEGKGRADAGMRSRVGWGGKAVWFGLDWFWCCVVFGCLPPQHFDYSNP